MKIEPYNYNPKQTYIFPYPKNERSGTHLWDGTITWSGTLFGIVTTGLVDGTLTDDRFAPIVLWFIVNQGALLL